MTLGLPCLMVLGFGPYDHSYLWPGAHALPNHVSDPLYEPPLPYPVPNLCNKQETVQVMSAPQIDGTLHRVGTCISAWCVS